MQPNKFSIFKNSKEFLENNCNLKFTNKDAFITKLIRDDNGCYNISDKEFSIRCIFEENFIKKFLGANDKINKNELHSKFYLKLKKKNIIIQI